MTPTPTLILDGIWGRQSRYKNLRRALESHVGPTEFFPYNCTGLACLHREAAKLAAHLHSRDPVNLLAFSMGGIVAREAHRISPDLPVRRAAFLNCPHRGSWWAYLATPFKFLRGIRQLRPTSTFIADLATTIWPIPTLAIWTPFDYAILPGASARWTNASESLRSGPLLHTWPLHSRRIRDKLLQFFSRPH